MAYSTYAEIQADFKDVTFTSTTLVKDTEVTQFIVEADSLIDSYVGKRYEVPITGTSSLSLMKLYSRTLVAERVRGILEVKQQTAQATNQNVRSGLSTKDILKLLSDIRDEKTDLVDATLLSDTGNFYSNNYTNDIQPVFKKNLKQWW